MNLSEKGWFKDFVKKRSTPKPDKIDDKESYIYRAVQPLGLMYGHPVIPKEFNTAEFIELDHADKMKLVLLEGFINTAVMPSNYVLPNDPEDFCSLPFERNS